MTTNEPEVPAPRGGGPEPRVRVLEVRRGGALDLDRAAELLGLAFADYPWTRWCVDGDDHVARITELQRISLEVVGLPLGLVWLGEIDDAITTVAVWSDSRARLDRSLFIELADRSRPLHGDRIDAAIHAESRGFRRPVSPHLFLETMGTHPDHWRSGFGAAVLQPGLERADGEGLVCGLETSTEGNVEFYRSVGFDVVDHRVVKPSVVARRGTEVRGPDVWAMWRDPQP